jgi:hypothetical protein
MRELLEMLKVVNSDNEVIAQAKGKYEYTGSIIKDTFKIVKNGRRDSI